jgi:predicted RecA/RadA family phage recombinase
MARSRFFSLFLPLIAPFYQFHSIRKVFVMKARYVQRGESIDFTPETDVAAGDIVKIGSLVGVAKLDIKAGELGALALVGVYEVETGGTAVAIGTVVSVDPATGKVCAEGTAGAVKLGHAVTKAETSDTTVLVRLAQGL